MHSVPFLVVNPHAANGRLGKVWPTLEASARRILGEIALEHTTRSGEATSIARRAVEAGHRLIVSVGGDGTHNEVANGLMQDDRSDPDVVMGLLPFGTGGDLRRTVGASTDVETQLRTLASGEDWTVDVGRLDFVDHEGAAAMRYFINIASCGVSGLTDILVNRTTKLFGGRVSFLIGTLRALAAYDYPLVTVEMDDLPSLTAPVSSVVVANGQFFGGGMHMAPDARMDDGLFDVVVAHKTGLAKSARTVPRLYRGEHLRFPWFAHSRAKVVTMRGEGVYLDVDGEAPGVLPATFRVIEGALKLRVERREHEQGHQEDQRKR